MSTTPGENRLAPGDLAPDFTLPDADNTPVTLSDFRGQKVVVYFYPAASTPGCTAQACDFSASVDDFKAAGYAILGISPDDTEKLAAFRDEVGTPFPLLSDPDRTVLNAWGAYGEKKLYGKVILGVIRSTFIVNEEGRIDTAQYNVRATGHVAKLRRELGV